MVLPEAGIITVASKQYAYTISENNHYHHVIRCGGVGAVHKCMTILIDLHTNVMLLSDVVYLETCQLNGKLERGPGTTRLLYATLVLALQRYPNMKILELQDESTFTCKFDGDEFKIPLSDHNILVYGKTWYARRFPDSFVLQKAKNQKLFEHLNTYLTNPDNYDSAHLTNFLERGEVLRYVKANMVNPLSGWFNSKTNQRLFKKITSKSRTYREFFQNMHELHDSCAFFSDTLNGFMGSFLKKGKSFKGMVWECPVHDLEQLLKAWQVNSPVQIEVTNSLYDHYETFLNAPLMAKNGHMGTIMPGESMDIVTF